VIQHPAEFVLQGNSVNYKSGLYAIAFPGRDGSLRNWFVEKVGTGVIIFQIKMGCPGGGFITDLEVIIFRIFCLKNGKF